MNILLKCVSIVISSFPRCFIGCHRNTSLRRLYLSGSSKGSGSARIAWDAPYLSEYGDGVRADAKLRPHLFLHADGPRDRGHALYGVQQLFVAARLLALMAERAGVQTEGRRRGSDTDHKTEKLERENSPNGTVSHAACY